MVLCARKLRPYALTKLGPLVPFHPLMNVVGRRWMYIIKHRVDGSIERYKTRLVARGFT
jgi:hypothetical protein